MTMLVDWQIKDLIEDGSFKVDPFDEKLVNPCSLDFKLGTKFGKSVPKTGSTNNVRTLNGFLTACINPTKSESFHTVWNEETDEFILNPKEFILATTAETFDFVKGVVGKVAGKSSLGRLGMAQSHVAGFIDVGFHGQITLELFNYSEHPIILIPGMKIGQLMLFGVADPDKDYKVTGRYSGQTGDQGSKGV